MLPRSLCCLFLCGDQLVLRSGVFTILILDLDAYEVDVTPSFAEVFRSVVLSVVGDSTGGWRCCWGAPSQLLPAATNNPPPYVILFLCFCSDGSNQHKIWAVGEICLYLGSGGGRAIWEQFYFQLFQESGDFA